MLKIVLNVYYMVWSPTQWIVDGCGFFEYPTLCSDPFVGLLNGQTDGQLASSICDNAVVILKWP